MKKLTAVLCVLLLLCTTLVCGVSAEGFVFREISREQTGTALYVTWNHTEATVDEEINIDDVLIGGKSRNFMLNDDDRLYIDLSGLAAGSYTVVYEYAVKDRTEKTTSPDPLVIEGTATVKLSATVNGEGLVTVKAVNGAGAPIVGYKLSLSVGNMTGMTYETGKNGTYTCPIELGYGETARYAGVQTQNGGVTYPAVAEQTVTRTGAPTTETTSPTTDTTVEGAETTETTGDTTGTTNAETTAATTGTVSGDATQAATQATVLGAGTTEELKGNRLALNVSTDEGILTLFGCKASTFAGNARFFVSKNDYLSLVQRDTSKRLMLNVLTAKTPATDTEVQAAVTGASEFAKYSDAEIVSVSFDMSFLVLDGAGNSVPVSAVPLGSLYEIELPVPASMKNCEAIAVTRPTENGLLQPAVVDVEGGTFKLQVEKLEGYTLIGFLSADGANKAGGVSGWVVLLFAVGVLLLAAAGVLLYFFVFRKAKPESENPEEPEIAGPIVPAIEDDGDDIFSGRTDL